MSRQAFDGAIRHHGGAINYFKEKGLWKPDHDSHDAALTECQ
jgi:hypothetical protein